MIINGILSFAVGAIVIAVSVGGLLALVLTAGRISHHICNISDDSDLFGDGVVFLIILFFIASIAYTCWGIGNSILSALGLFG